MSSTKPASPSDPQQIVTYLSQKATEQTDTHQHGGPMQTLRQATHKGRRIVVRTTYEITIDGDPLAGHVEVANNGLVYHHALANYSFPSTIELVKELIDRFPDEFPVHDHGDHHTPNSDHAHDHGHTHEGG